MVLTGPSGCGKTTLTRLLNGLIPHFYEGTRTGEITVYGADPGEQALWDTSSDVGSVFQNPRSQFFTTDPVSEIAFACENYGLPAEITTERVEQAIVDFDFSALRGRSIFALSGGEKQRLACASVAAARPKLYVLDEPSANLDAEATRHLRDIMGRWKAEGATLVIAEHRVAYLQDIVDRVVFLEDGRVTRELSGDEYRALDDPALREHGLRPSVTLTPQPTFVCGDTPAIDVVGVRYRYRRRGISDAVRIDRLSFPKGRITAITGTNGAGKTTLVRWMAGLLRASDGEFYDEGRSLRRKDRRKKIFLILQDVNHQLVTESVADEVEVTLRLAGAPADEWPERRAAILESVDLVGYEDRHPMALSGGQKQRLAVGTALASGREIVILDEPTSGLDVAHMEQVVDVMRTLRDAGKTVIVVTHDRHLIEAAADHVIEMYPPAA